MKGLSMGQLLVYVLSSSVPHRNHIISDRETAFTIGILAEERARSPNLCTRSEFLWI